MHMPGLRSILRPIVLAVALAGAAVFAARPALAQAEHKASPVEAPAAGHTPAAPAAHAPDAHGESHLSTAGVLPTKEEGIVPMVVSLVVFGLVFAVLATTAWPKIVKGLKDREDKIRSEIEAAELAQKQAKAALQEYEKNLASARAEAQRMLEETKAQQQALAADLKAKADVELTGMREKAKRDIDTAKRAAIDEIYSQAASAATAMAAKILKREIGSQDQQRLIQESMGELQAAVARNN
jgi:F-type H+-transporting ATPase subunit b